MAAEGNFAAVADFYNLPASQVQEAVAFERQLRMAA